jgi:uncharacterized membrane protein YhhN
MVKPMVFGSTAAYLILAALYTIPLTQNNALYLPVGFLCLISLWLTPWEISLALLFSALGDFAGSCNCLLPQIGAFTVAQVLYTIFFIRRYHRKVETDRKLTEKAKGYLAMTSFCVISLLTLILVKVVPAAPAGIIQTGVGTYGFVICIMMFAALLQRSMLYAFGALLFVISDFLLAWNLFIESVPYASALILGTYFAAQWLLFVRATPYRVSHPVHLLRF